MMQHSRTLTARHNQRGLSLIELMIALVISSFLMLGVFQVFVGSSGTDRISHAFARVQENGRLAIDILTRSLRMAGYQGCIDTEVIDLRVIANNAPSLDLTNEAVIGYETDHSSWDAINRNDALDPISGALVGSDVVFVQFVNPTGTDVVCTGAANSNSCFSQNANIKISDNNAGFTQHDIVVVSDCVNADMFRISNTAKDASDNFKVTLAHANNVNSSNRLSKAYGEDAQVMKFEALAYYIKDTGRRTDQGGAIYALYHYDAMYHDGAGNYGIEQELVEGVEQLQILYGQRRTDGNLRYVTADDGDLDFSQVEALKIAVLVSSSQNVLPDADSKDYLLPGATVEPLGAVTPEATHPGDRRLRQVFATTIQLRNRNR
ncbi:PilW family protein [Motiliproteus sediminis]|uniref:PilW family protein n=1 Tax=Motiliproteus sediminis TaxID=1468178 RepID=UPI001AEFEEAD|nr:PilW family protein [Motiliproteus sediminis]